MSVLVDHNYPAIDDLKIVDSEGAPIEGAEIRVFDHTAFNANERETWEAATTTDINGYWVDPIVLEAGRTWVVHVEKPTLYGPVHLEVTT